MSCRRERLGISGNAQICRPDGTAFMVVDTVTGRNYAGPFDSNQRAHAVVADTNYPWPERLAVESDDITAYIDLDE